MTIHRRQILKALGLLGISALAGCGGTAAPASSAPASSAASAPAEPVMELTLSSNVRRDTFVGLADYADFEAMAQKLFLLPGLCENQIPQGICRSQSTGRIYISAYSSIKLASVVMVMNDAGDYLAEYHLKKADGSDFKGHVGGVAVTDTTLFLSNTLDSDGSYSIAAIPLDSLVAEGRQDVVVDETVLTVPVSPSLLSYNDGILWVGNFYHPDADYVLSPNMNYTTPADGGAEAYGTYLLGYQLDADGGIGRLQPEAGKQFTLPDHVLAAPWKIQGMVYEPNSGTVVLSQSYGRKNNAALLRYRVDLAGKADTTVTLDGAELPCFVLDGARLTHNIVSIPMTEGLTLDADRNVLVLYESGANKYKDGKHRTDYLWKAVFTD